MCTWSRRRMRLMKWILKVWRSHRVGQGKVHWIWQTSLNWIKSVFNFQQSTLLLQAWTFGPCLWSTQHQSVVLFFVGKVWVSHEYCKTTLRDGSVPYQSYPSEAYLNYWNVSWFALHSRGVLPMASVESIYHWRSLRRFPWILKRISGLLVFVVQFFFGKHDFHQRYAETGKLHQWNIHG